MYYCKNNKLAQNIRLNNRRLRMSAYIELLKNLVACPLDEKMILNPLDADSFLESMRGAESNQITYRCSFNDKAQLREIINRHCLMTQPHLLFTHYSEECGPLKLPSLIDFNWDFKFDAEPSGLIVFYSIDKSYQLVLDYYNEQDKKQIDMKFIEFAS